MALVFMDNVGQIGLGYYPEKHKTP